MNNLTKHPCENNTDFIVGDVVVFKTFHMNILLEIDLLINPEHVGYKGYASKKWFEGFVSVSEIRHATPAELKAKKRLPEPVALFVDGEV